MTQIPLPSIIEGLAQTTKVLLAQQAQPSQPSQPALVIPDEPDAKKIVILVTRDISKDDKKLLSTYGVVKEYDKSVYLNLSLQQIDFDYLIVDLREAGDRLFYQKSIQGSTDYHQVIYKWDWEEVAIPVESSFSSFPTVQASKREYDRLLYIPPIQAPTPCLSLLKVLGTCGSQ